MNVEHRAYIKIRSLLGDTPRNIFNDLSRVYGSDACSESTVKKLSIRFREGREAIADDPRAGRPVTATTTNNISLVSKMIEEEPHITIEGIANHVDLSSGTVHEILSLHLGLRKVCSRWVPHLLSDSQKKTRLDAAKSLLKIYSHCNERRLFEICTGDETWIRFSEPLRKEQNRVWLPKGTDPPAIPRPDHWGRKVMYTIFFDAHGPVCQICTPKGRTVTGNFYATVILPAIKKHYLERRPGCGLRGIKLLHDNARPHKSKQVKDKLKSMRLVELDHPPYSPDLAPCDFWLFDGLKKHLAGKTFDERMQLGRTIQRYLRDIPEEEYKKTFYMWVERLKLVIK